MYTHMHAHTHACTYTMYKCTRTHSYIVGSDYNLTNFTLGPFSDDVRELSFDVSIVDDKIPENDTMFQVSLTLDGQASLSSRVTVSSPRATITIKDDGK